MFTTFLTISIATLGLMVNVADVSAAKPTCCMKHAYCCSVQRSCCPKAEVTNVKAEQAVAVSGEVTKPICCMKHAYCCSSHRNCCPKATAATPGDPALMVTLDREVIGKQTCCIKHAYCCSVKRACCGRSAAEMSV